MDQGTKTEFNPTCVIPINKKPIHPAKAFLKEVLSAVKDTEVELHVKDNIYKKDSENNFDITVTTADNVKTNIQISNQGKIKIKHEIK